MARKPEGMHEFEALMRPLAKVPKAQLDAEVEKDAKRKAAKKAKPKKKQPKS